MLSEMEKISNISLLKMGYLNAKKNIHVIEKYANINIMV